MTHTDEPDFTIPEAEKQKALYWNAFYARLWAAGLPIVSIAITGNEKLLMDVNEALRANLSELQDDAATVEWYKQHREALLRSQAHKTAFHSLASKIAT
jgi:hypothetical protein